MTIRSATKIMFERYASMIEDMNDSEPLGAPETSFSHIRGMCAVAIENTDVWPLDKLNRWLGYIQGCLTCRGVLSVDKERDFSRILFHAAYASEAIDIPETACLNKN